MEVTLDKKNNVNALITIKLDETDYGTKVKKTLKEYAQKAQLKGFRPGKVPIGHIKRMYGKSVLAQEVSELANESLKNYLEEEKLRLVANPLFSETESPEVDWDTQKKFSFVYEVGLEPEMDYETAFSKIQLTKREIEISEEDVNEYIENLRKFYGERPELEESEAGDNLIGTFRQGDFSNAGSFQINELPESEQAKFIGVKKEETVSFDLRSVFSTNEKLLECFHDAKLDSIKDLEGEFTFDVHNINRTVPAEIGQKLFDSVLGEGKAKDEESFREAVRAIIQKYYDIQTGDLLTADFQTETTQVLEVPEFPDDFLRRWLLTNEGVNEGNLEENFKMFRKSILWEITRNQASEAQELANPSQEDLVAQLKKRFFMQYYQMNILNMSDEVMDMFVQQFFQNSENQGQVMAEMNTLSTTQLLTKIKDTLQIETVKMTREEFEQFSKEQWERIQAEQAAEKVQNVTGVIEDTEAEEIVEA